MVDGGGLENHCTGNGAGGSNPSPSANALGPLRIRDSGRNHREQDDVGLQILMPIQPPANVAIHDE